MCQNTKNTTTRPLSALTTGTIGPDDDEMAAAAAGLETPWYVHFKFLFFLVFFLYLLTTIYV